MGGLMLLAAALLALTLWLATGWWLAGALLRGGRRLVHRARPSDDRSASPAPRWATAGLALLLVVGAPWLGLEVLQRQAYRDALPPALANGTLLWHHTESGLREGCGVAIYRLDNAALQALRQQGGDWLTSARLGRDGRAYHHYAPWRETPAPSTGTEAPALLRGWSCVQETPPELAAVSRALARPGSHYTTGPEHDLVVVPALGLLVFSFFG